MAGSRITPMLRSIGVVVACLIVAGCYSLQVAPGLDVTVGSQVAFDINDAGRVALGGVMGPELSQVEGRVYSKESGVYVLAVTMVHLLRGGEQVWTGERISIRSEYVTKVYERRFSKGRTIAASVAGAGVVLIFVTRAITGAGRSDVGKEPVDTAHSARRPVYGRP